MDEAQLVLQFISLSEQCLVVEHPIHSSWSSLVWIYCQVKTYLERENWIKLALPNACLCPPTEVDESHGRVITGKHCCQDGKVLKKSERS